MLNPDERSEKCSGPPIRFGGPNQVKSFSAGKFLGKDEAQMLLVLMPGLYMKVQALLPLESGI